LYKTVFFRAKTLEEGIELAKKELPQTPEVRLFLDFIETPSKRGIAPEAKKC